MTRIYTDDPSNKRTKITKNKNREKNNCMNAANKQNLTKENLDRKTLREKTESLLTTKHHKNQLFKS